MSDIDKMFELFSQMKSMMSDEEIAQTLEQIKNKGPKSYWNGKRRSERGQDFIEFFDKNFPNTKRDYFKNTVMTKDIEGTTDWEPILNHKKHIEAICSDIGLSPNFMDRHLARWYSSKKPELLINIPEWDGKNHIFEALKLIEVDNIGHELFVDLMMGWFSRIFMRIYNPKIQNRLPIFRGNQGIGKDYSIRSMTAGFDRYMNEIDLGNNNKTEIYRIIRGLAVAIIPEFDETNKTSLSTLKSIITAESVELRELYETNAKNVKIRTSFISSSNFKDILRDPTGNRRFLIFNIKDIDHQFHLVNGPQILAQSHHLYKTNYQTSTASEDAMKKIIINETPINQDSLFAEEIRELLKNKYQQIYRDRLDFYSQKVEGGTNIPDKLRWFNISDQVMKIAKNYNFSVRIAQQVIKRYGMTHEDSKSTYYEPGL